MKTIPLRSGQGHFKFKAGLNGTVAEFRVNWLSRYEYFSVDMSVDGTNIFSGRGLHPNVDLLDGTDIEGTLILSGAQPTVDNLGNANELIYRSPDD